MNEIKFEFEGKTYKVGMEAYDKNLIILPDGRILKVTGWLESYPPQVYEIKEITHSYCTAKEI